MLGYDLVAIRDDEGNIDVLHVNEFEEYMKQSGIVLSKLKEKK